MFNIRKVLQLGILISSIAPSMVLAGGANGGGGNSIESLFKTSALELSRSILDFHQSSKDLLAFDPQKLFDALNDEKGFFVLCAADENLEKIRKEKKMARVFNEMPGTVYLNCSDYKYKDWKEKLDWSKLENALFITHEGMRVMDMAGENNYGLSKSYIQAKENEEKLEYDKLATYMLSRNSDCSISFSCKEMVFLSNYCRVTFYVNGNDVFSKIYSADIRDFQSQILNKTTKVGIEANKDLMSVVKKNKCE